MKVALLALDDDPTCVVHVLLHAPDEQERGHSVDGFEELTC